MDDAAVIGLGKISQVPLTDAKTTQLKDRLERLLQEAAEVEVELRRAEGAIRGLPHYSVIEGRAHAWGQRLSREMQERQMREVAASHPLLGKCPECGTRCELEPSIRQVKSVDGSVDLRELVGECPCCRRSFFPVAGDAGI